MGSSKKEKIKRKKIRKIKKLIKTITLIILIIILFRTILKKDKPKQSIETISPIETNIIIPEEIKPEIESRTTDWDLILVNKQNQIPEDYAVQLSSIGNNHKIDHRIFDELTQMLNDARKQGLKPLICSSYRSNYTQKILYNRKVTEFINLGYSKKDAEEKASYWVTIPGTSEHEIGLALDIVSIDYQILDKNQENTQVQKWLIENCHKYGFILRYPNDKKEITQINYEPWHYRYVGKENAKFMKEKDYCLEEFIEYLKQYEY